MRAGRKPTRPGIERRIRDYDPKLDPDEDLFVAACVMLASAYHGPNADRLARVLERPRAQIRRFGQNCRNGGVWEGRRVIHSGWDDEEHGGIAFTLDAGTAMGWFTKVA